MTVWITINYMQNQEIPLKGWAMYYMYITPEKKSRKFLNSIATSIGIQRENVQQQDVNPMK